MKSGALDVLAAAIPALTTTPRPAAGANASPSSILTTIGTHLVVATDGFVDFATSKPVEVAKYVFSGALKPLEKIPVVGYLAKVIDDYALISAGIDHQNAEGGFDKFTTALDVIAGAIGEIPGPIGEWGSTAVESFNNGFKAGVFIVGKGVELLVPPVAVPLDPAKLVPDPVTGDVDGQSNFVDPGGEPLKYKGPATGTSAGGAAVFVTSTTGTFDYFPTDAQRQQADTSTTDTFTITAINSVGRRTTTTVTVHVLPTVTSDVGAPSSTGVVTGTVKVKTAGSTSVGYTALGAGTNGSVATKDGGTVTVNTDGTFTYTPNQTDTNATDSFGVNASWGRYSAIGIITVPVGNNAPITGDWSTGGSGKPTFTVTKAGDTYNWYSNYGQFGPLDTVFLTTTQTSPGTYAGPVTQAALDYLNGPYAPAVYINSEYWTITVAPDGNSIDIHLDEVIEGVPYSGDFATFLRWPYVSATAP